MSADLYEFAAATTDVPWAEAEARGWFDCLDAGGWLKPVKGLLVPGSRGQAVERMLVRAFTLEGLTRGDGKGWRGFAIDEGRVEARRAFFDEMLAAALGEQETL